MTGVRDELANNLAKLTSIDDRKSEVERHLVREHRKLTETDDTEMLREIRDRIRKLESVHSDIELERQARLKTLSTNRATLRPEINRIREIFRLLLHEDITLAKRIRTLFREQRITIASILTAIGMAISTLVFALTGGGGSAPAPAPEWDKDTCRPSGVAWVIWPAMLLQPCPVSLAQLCLGSWEHWERPPLGS